MCKYSLKQLDNRAKKLKDLQAQADALKAEIDALKKDLQTSFEIEGPFTEFTDHYKFNAYWIPRVNIDRTRFEKDYPELWNEYKKETRSLAFRVDHI